jgi:hypothetical protein
MPSATSQTFEVIPNEPDDEVDCYYVRHSSTKVVLCRCHVREFAELLRNAMEEHTRAIEKIAAVDVDAHHHGARPKER